MHRRNRIAQPSGARRKPALYGPDGIGRHDVTEQNFERADMPRVKEQVSPPEIVRDNTERRPADEPAQLANGDDEVRRLVRAVKVAPAEIPSVTPSQETVRRRHAGKQVVKLGAR